MRKQDGRAGGTATLVARGPEEVKRDEKRPTFADHDTGAAMPIPGNGGINSRRGCVDGTPYQASFEGSKINCRSRWLDRRRIASHERTGDPAGGSQLLHYCEREPVP